MAFLFSSAFFFSSSITGAYIYKFHSDHFKETIFNATVETYTLAKESYYSIRSSVGYPVENPKPHIDITDVRLIHPNGDIINLSPQNYQSFDLSKLTKDVLLHIVYKYGDQTYRIVFSPGQNLNILDDNLDWLENGFHNGLDRVVNEDYHSSDSLYELMTQYAGPLSDFYDEVKLHQDPRGFLNSNLTERLFSGVNQNAIIKVYDILGENHIFKADHFSVSSSSLQEVIQLQLQSNEQLDTIVQGMPPVGYYKDNDSDTVYI